MPTQNNWRDKTKKLLKSYKVTFYDPDEFENATNMATIVNFDKSIISRCDLVIANITRYSPGTSMEVLFAYNLNIPVLLVADDDAIKHPWLKYHSSFIVDDINKIKPIIDKLIKRIKY